MGEGCGPSPVLPAVVRVEETLAGDVSGPEFPRAETGRQRPIDLPNITKNVRPASTPELV